MHFSKYSLLDDDDDKNKDRRENINTPMDDYNQDNLPAKRKFEPPQTANIQMNHATMDKSKSLLAKGRHLIEMDADLPPLKMESIRTEAEKVDNEIRMKYNMAVLKRTSKKSVAEVEELDSFEVEGECETYVEAARHASPPDFDRLFRASTSSFSITQSLLEKQRITTSSIDMSLRMRRSFRVGWLPNGAFIKLAPKGVSIALLQSRPMIWEQQTYESSIELLQNHQKHALPADNGKGPFLVLPCGEMDTARFDMIMDDLTAVAGIDENVEQCFYLLSTLSHVKRQAKVASEALIYGIFQYLIKLCESDVNEEISSAIEQQDSLSAIVAAISGGNIDKAAMLAAEYGYMNLLVVLCAGLDSRQDLTEQLIQMKETGLLNSTTSRTQRVLYFLAGDGTYEDKLFRNGKSDLDWRRRLTMRVWQSLDEDFTQVIRSYEASMNSGDVPFPCPRYESFSKGSTSQDLIFKFLKFFTPEKFSLLDAILPSGFTNREHDFSLPFHLAAVACAAKAVLTIRSIDAEYLQNGYESQLIGCGRWEWAVFVSLCVLGHLSDEQKLAKLKRAKDIITRYYTEDDSMAREFLEDILGIPSAWFAEATAYRSVYNHDLPAFVQNAMNYDVMSALAVAEYTYLPEIFFRNEQLRVSEIQTLAKCADHECLISIMVQYFLLEEKLAESSIEAQKDQLVALSNIRCETEYRLRAYQTGIGRGLLKPKLFIGDDAVHKTIAMVSSTLDYLRIMQVKIDALVMAAQ